MSIRAATSRFLDAVFSGDDAAAQAALTDLQALKMQAGYDPGRFLYVLAPNGVSMNAHAHQVEVYRNHMNCRIYETAKTGQALDDFARRAERN